jgi:predicted Zn-dependent peptidase
MSSRLWHEIREKRGLAYYVRAGTEYYKDNGYIAATAGVDPKRIDDAIKVMASEFSKFSKGQAKVTKDELTKAKEYLKGHLVLELEDSRAAAIFYTTQKTLEKKVKNPDEIISEIDKIKLEEVVKIAKEFLKPQNLNLAIIGSFKDPKRFEKLLKM